MTLTKKDLDLALDALDMAVELLETVWLKDPGNTRQDTREIRANIKRMWELVGRLVVHAPEHHMAFSMPSHHQLKIGGTGSSARLRRHLDELGVSDNSARRGKRATGTARNRCRADQWAHAQIGDQERRPALLARYLPNLP